MTASLSRAAAPVAALLLASCLLLSATDALYCGKDNCYELLDVPRNATKLELRRSFRRLSVSLHPDKNPDDAKAQERFRKMNAAYEALKDDHKRAKYNDFLDNPAKYWDFLVSVSPEVYAPKSNVALVIVGLVAVVTLINWATMNQRYKETLRRMRETVEFKREVSRLLKANKAATREAAEAMINLDVVGLEEPHWRNLVIVKLFTSMPDAAKFVLWNLKWFVMYKVFKRPYSDSDKPYVIRTNLRLSEEEWDATPDKEKEEYLKEELWDKEKCDEYLRLKRIELNKLGKGKKKKKHTPQYYSEAEPVNMNDGSMSM